MFDKDVINGNLDWTDFGAGPAEAACIWKVIGILEAQKHWVKYCANRSRVHPPICMPTYLLIDGTRVDTGCAADTAKDGTKLFICENR
jgi:hypothetical protein